MNELHFAFARNERSKVLKIALNLVRRCFINRRLIMYLTGLTNRNLNDIISRKFDFKEE